MGERSSSSSSKKHHEHHRSSTSSSSSHRPSSSTRHVSSHHRDNQDDDDPDDRRDSKRSRSSHHTSRSSRRKREHDHDEEEGGDDEWVEAPSTAASQGAASSLLTIPARSAQGPPIDTVSTFEVGAIGSVTHGLRSTVDDSDMTDGYGEGEDGSSRKGGGGRFGDLMSAAGPTGGDLFSAMGTERKRREIKQKPDPSMMMGQSSRELNKAHWQGVPQDPPTAVPTVQSNASPAPGSSGSAWRMSKLKRTSEVADEEGREVEDVALERYGSLDAFKEANEERRVLDEREDRRRGRRSMGGPGGGGPSTPGGERGARQFVFTDSGTDSVGPSRPGSRGSFRRPGEAPSSAIERINSSSSSKEGSRPSTPPVPSVLTPRPSATTPRTSYLSQSVVLVPDPTTTTVDLSPVLSQTELNKLQAKVLKAKLMGLDEARALEEEYEKERVRAAEAQGPMGHVEKVGTKVEMVPTLDAQGRLYDIGTGDNPEKDRKANGRKQKDKAFQSHDPKTGEVIRQSAEDDVSLAELVRQERFGGGAGDQKRLDDEFASRIATDRRFTNDLDYMDEHADALARKKMKSDTIKKAFAIQDYAKTKKALDSCTMCFSDSGGPPRSAVVALGTRAYLGLLDHEELVPGHCRIVPIQHHFSSLDADDETWDEIKNFMKTLMQYFAASDRGVLFFETVISLRHQKHTSIEALPVAFELFDQLPVYFREAILTSESEWSQNKKLITFSAHRPFRRALVPNLPYFMVQFDYKGGNGFGHVIEGIDDTTERDKDGDELRDYTGGEKGQEFQRYFAQEIVGNLLRLEPRQWRKPRRIDARKNDERVKAFRKGYDAYDWTKMLSQSSSSASASGRGNEAEEGVARE